MQVRKPKQGYKSIKSFSGKYEEIPEEWKLDSLGNLCEIQKEKNVDSNLYVGLEHIGQGTNSLVGKGDVKQFTSTKNVFKKGDVLYGKLRPLLNKVWLATEDGFCSTDILPIKIKNELDNRILEKIISSQDFITHALSSSSGTKMPRTNWSDISKYEIKLPPIKEQQKIASILLNVDSLIQQTQKIIEKTQKLKNGLIQKLLIKGIGHTKFKTVTLNPKVLKFTIPEDWNFIKFNKLTQQITDGTHYTPEYVSEGIPFLRVTDIQTKSIDWKSVKKIKIVEHKELIKRCKPEKGDILYSKNGTVGITKIVDWDNEFSIFVSLCLIKPLIQKASINYLFWVLQSKIIKIQMQLRSKQLSVQNLHLEEIRDFDIPLPTIDEQQKIALILSNIDSQIQKQEEYKSKLEILKTGLMQKLLTGQIRVKI